MSAFKPERDPYGPCPCNSGKKYKFCCLPKDRETAHEKTEAPTEGGPVAMDKLLSAHEHPGGHASRPARASEGGGGSVQLPRTTKRGK